MQRLAEICIRRPVFATMIILALVVVGSAAYFKLGVDRLPAVDIPTVTVRTSFRGAAPEEVENNITQKIEQAVNTVEGIEELRSVSGAGNSFVIATFSLSRSIDAAAQDVRDRVSAIQRDLPDDVDPPIVAKFDNDSQPILSIAVTGNRSQRELTELADKVVRPQLERSTGVGQVRVVGGQQRAINVWIDSARLASYEIPITTVRAAIASQNADASAGNVTGADREVVLRTLGRYRSAAQMNDLVITNINGQPIRLRDVGHVEDGHKEVRNTARLNGTPTVVLEILRQSGANTIEVIEAAKANIARIADQVPPDVRLEVIRDQSRYIYAALHEINLHLVLGSILASLVVLFFMKSWRSTLIAAIAIPTSVISTFGMMWALHFTLNSVTMLALVLMVGVVIDDAIVVLENIFRFVEEKKMNAFQAAKAATAEIGLAVLATTFSLVIIFIPVSFMSSVSGRFLYQFGITAAVAVLVSLLVSFTLTPMMSARFLKIGAHSGDSRSAEAKSRKGFYHLLDTAYAWMLGLCVRQRFIVAALALAIVGTSIPLYKIVKQEFVPTDVDEAEFQVNLRAREGTTLAAMDEAARVLEEEIRQVRGVRTVLSTTGGSFISAVNSGEMYVRIAPHEERVVTPRRIWEGIKAGDPRAAWRGNYSQADVMQDIRKRVSKFRDLRCQVRNFVSFNTGSTFVDIDFGIRGPELKVLNDFAERLKVKAGEVGGIVDADTTLRLDKPEIRVVPDRDRAADLGIKSEDLNMAMRLMVGGETEVSRFRDEKLNEDYHVDLRLIESDRNSPRTLGNLYIPRAGGGLVQLENVAQMVETQTASRIDRVDRLRVVSLRAGVGPGYALGDRIKALRQAAEEIGVPPGYNIRISGRGRELEKTFVEFGWAFLLSVIFMYMILAAQFESFVHPLTILLSLPLSVPFALLSLWWTDGTLNLYSALGILVLFGVVKKNAILQIDHMNQLRERGMERFDAIIQANRDRLRPILMTTLALVAGMLPLWLGSGPGAEERRAVAVVVIGGQTLSLLLTLLVTPVAYCIFDDLGRLVRGRSHQDSARAALAVAPVDQEDVLAGTQS